MTGIHDDAVRSPGITLCALKKEEFQVTSTKALYTTSVPDALNLTLVPAPMKNTSPSPLKSCDSNALFHSKEPADLITMKILGPWIAGCSSSSPSSSCVTKTANSSIGGS